MRMSTKTLASLLVVSMVATVPGVRRTGRNKQPSRFERILQRHDRKGELRAALLGVTPLEFRELQSKYSIEELVKQFGFKNESAYRKALFGKIRDELRHRGWTNTKIERFVKSRQVS